MTNEKSLPPWLGAELEASRPHLLRVAYRMLGSQPEAEDALQEVWLRLSRADPSSIDNPRGWLTTIVARVCLDLLRARKARPEQASLPAVEPTYEEPGPVERALVADSLGVALMVVLETLSPSERLAFVLHDLFDLPFEQVAEVLSTTSEAARQLASRARRRVRGQGESEEPSDPQRQRAVVEAFLVASRTGDLAGLLRLLHPDVVLRADAFAVEAGQRRRAQGAPELAPQTTGADAVARAFSGRASAAELASIDGRLGAVWAPGGKPHAAFSMTIEDGLIRAIQIVAEPVELAALEILIDSSQMP
jgi:RNA polymerase sigma factor (sigma-70 family)